MREQAAAGLTAAAGSFPRRARAREAWGHLRRWPQGRSSQWGSWPPLAASPGGRGAAASRSRPFPRCAGGAAPPYPSLPWSGGGWLFGLAAAMPPPPSPSPPWLGRRGWGFGSACAAPSLPSVARWRPGSSPPFRALARRADATASPSPPCLVVAGDWGRGAVFGREDPRPPPQRAGRRGRSNGRSSPDGSAARGAGGRWPWPAAARSGPRGRGLSQSPAVGRRIDGRDFA